MSLFSYICGSSFFAYCSAGFWESVNVICSFFLALDSHCSHSWCCFMEKMGILTAYSLVCFELNSNSFCLILGFLNSMNLKFFCVLCETLPFDHQFLIYKQCKTEHWESAKVFGVGGSLIWKGFLKWRMTEFFID